MCSNLSGSIFYKLWEFCFVWLKWKKTTKVWINSLFSKIISYCFLHKRWTERKLFFRSKKCQRRISTIFPMWHESGWGWWVEPGVGWSELRRRWSPRRRRGARCAEPLGFSPLESGWNLNPKIFVLKIFTLCCFSGRSCSFTYGSLQSIVKCVFCIFEE